MTRPSSPARPRLLPDGLRIAHLATDHAGIILRAESAASSSRCPVCGASSRRIHSRYMSTVSDLPWRVIAVRLEVRARKFFCDRRRCERRIFCERLEEVATRARKTARLEEALLAITFALGGEAGARLARELGLLICPDVLVDRIRRLSRTSVRAAAEGARVLGIDDFAFRKGAE